MWENLKGVKKNAYGFFQLDPIPTLEELEKHYREKYYQETQSDTYLQEYDSDELEYIHSCLEEKEYLLKKFLRDDQRTFWILVAARVGHLLFSMSMAGRWRAEIFQAMA